MSHLPVRTKLAKAKTKTALGLFSPDPPCMDSSEEIFLLGFKS